MDNINDTQIKKMKSKTCELCGGRSYKINYYYTHLISKRHKQNIIKKQSTILDIDKTTNKENTMRLLNELIEQINTIKINI